MTNCKKYIHILIGVYLLVTFNAFAKSDADIMVYRKPANFVPDDDLIIVPIIIERNFIDEFHEKHKKDFSVARKKINLWLRQEQYVQDYGLENTGIIRLPTPQEKEKFFRRNYLRFISKDVEKSTNKGLQNSWEEWTADDEIDAIKTMELHEKVLVKAKKSHGNGKEKLKAVSTVKVGKNKFKIGFQARPEIGMMKFDIRSNYFDARAWVGVNGNQELKIERRFRATNTSVFVNYYIEQEELLAVIDQGLIPFWSLRFTHSRDADYLIDIKRSYGKEVNENNILQLRFNMRF